MQPHKTPRTNVRARGAHRLKTSQKRGAASEIRTPDLRITSVSLTYRVEPVCLTFVLASMRSEMNYVLLTPGCSGSVLAELLAKKLDKPGGANSNSNALGARRGRTSSRALRSEELDCLEDLV